MGGDTRTNVFMFQTLGQGGELMQIMLIIFCMGVQLGVYCWFGEQLTYQVLETLKKKYPPCS
jgi:hypothetical protein